MTAVGKTRATGHDASNQQDVGYVEKTLRAHARQIESLESKMMSNESKMKLAVIGLGVFALIFAGATGFATFKAGTFEGHKEAYDHALSKCIGVVKEAGEKLTCFDEKENVVSSLYNYVVGFAKSSK